MRRIILLIALLLASPAVAADFTKPLLDLEGKPILAANIPLTLGEAVATALLANYADEQNLSGEEKVKRFLLAVKVHNATELGLTSDEITLIKKLVAKAFAPLVVGRIWAILDPPSIPTK
jgi:hypothetical protein